MRCFIAVELTNGARQEVAALQADLCRTSADVKWVEPENLHLTLKFLGEVAEDQLPALKGVLQQTTLHLSPFTLTLEGVGAFPRPQHPRVIWVGIKEGSEALTALAGAVEEACGTFVLSPSKGEWSFSPHLTIGRVHSGEHLSELVKKLKEVSFQASVPATIDRLILFQSILSRNSPTYTPLESFLLRTT